METIREQLDLFGAPKEMTTPKNKKSQKKKTDNSSTDEQGSLMGSSHIAADGQLWYDNKRFEHRGTWWTVYRVGHRYMMIQDDDGNKTVWSTEHNCLEAEIPKESTQEQAWKVGDQISSEQMIWKVVDVGPQLLRIVSPSGEEAAYSIEKRRILR